MATAESSKIVVPSIPESVYDDEEVPLMGVWLLALRSDTSIGRDRIKVRMVISPDEFAMKGLVMFGPNPLQYEDAANKQLRKEFVLDYLSCDVVDPDDFDMTQSEGVTVKNLNGKPLVFKKLSNGLLKVNDVLVRSTRTLDDGIIVHELDEVLFDHQSKIDDAVDVLIEKASSDEDLGLTDEEDCEIIPET
ncbi:uncharacterized protein [Palaemon carinicauda]|uniref:uncharacterized protein n=1 Tax=Palaemon carinicauda TaxID=392227 RepID=UPI0035B6392D